MKLLATALLAAACAFPVSAEAGAPIARPTEKCATSWTQSIYATFDAASTLASQSVNAVRNPAADPKLAFRLWNPISVQDSQLTGQGVRMLVFQYPLPQDVEQITKSLREDSRFSVPEVRSIDVNGNICIALYAPPVVITLTEYFNANLGHYLLSTTVHENQFVDRGEWGAGWVRTGETFQAYAPDPCSGQTHPVHRHYGRNSKGPPSLFYTLKGEECGYLQNHNIGWTYFDRTFGAFPPVSGGCSATQIAVFRLYNNRWMFNDSNHRYTTKPAIYEFMQQQGWAGEGVAFCLPTLQL